MIDKQYGRYVPTCDICGEVLPGKDSFDEARHAIKEAGWITTMMGSTWVNYCPTCQKGA